MRLAGLTLVACIMLPTGPATAAPAVALACFDREYRATITLSDDRATAFVSTGGQQYRLSKTSGGPGDIDYAGRGFTLRGFLPTATLRAGSERQVECHQTKDSVKAAALAGRPGFGWSAYNVAGQGFQSVRTRPSPQAERLASLPAGAPVTIIENTDEFLDGFFWFRVRLSDRREGYVWGALLCTDAVDEGSELRATVRKCAG